jgi:hypothetical protein
MARNVRAILTPKHIPCFLSTQSSNPTDAKIQREFRFPRSSVDRIALPAPGPAQYRRGQHCVQYAHVITRGSGPGPRIGQRENSLLAQVMAPKRKNEVLSGNGYLFVPLAEWELLNSGCRY